MLKLAICTYYCFMRLLLMQTRLLRNKQATNGHQAVTKKLLLFVCRPQIIINIKTLKKMETTPLYIFKYTLKNTLCASTVDQKHHCLPNAINKRALFQLKTKSYQPLFAISVLQQD